MVWKSVKLFLVIIMAAVMLTVSASAASYTPYDGNISTTYITIFRDIASGLSPSDNYVFFRSGQYEYRMVVGDVVYENNTFTLSSGTAYVIFTESTSGYNSTYVYFVTDVSDFSLSPGTSLIYSNLGDYPDLIERGDKYEFAQVLLLFVGLCILLLRSIFNFSLRNRC